MTAMEWATVSWTSLAIRSRSASTRRRASSSLVCSARSARSSASAARARLARTDSPSAAAMMAPPIRKNTHPAALNGCRSAVTSQTVMSRTLPAAMMCSDRRPSPSAITV
jgi:hypothetical protein